MFLVLETLELCEQTRKHFSATEMFLNLLGDIFGCQEAKFCFANNVSRGGQIGKQHI